MAPTRSVKQLYNCPVGTNNHLPSRMQNTVYLQDVPPGKHSLPPTIPHAAHRHAAPSGPWPWFDLVDDDAPFPIVPPEHSKRKGTANPENDSRDQDWRRYPELLYPNWTHYRLVRSGIAGVIDKPSDRRCVLYHIDVGSDGHFSQPGHHTVEHEKEEEFWKMMTERKRVDRNRVRLIFVENISGAVLQMLGTTYNIEPFFFSSSLNWIPSRYQENVIENDSDHITLILTFLRSMPNPVTAPNTPMLGGQFFSQIMSRPGQTTINTQAPLILKSCDKILLLDLISLHMVRRKDGSTVISYHPTSEWKSTSARYLHSRVRYAGESVYWQSLFRQSQDPTLVMLCMLWYPLYGWDESLETLYSHISWLESRVLIANDIHLTRELHIIRAYLLHYASLLESFRKSVLFLRNTPNPAMKDQDDFQKSMDVMNRECDTLLSEIERLDMYRRMQEMRLDNVVNLAFASVNFQDSRDMQRLSEASLRDGTGLHESKERNDEIETTVLYRLQWPIRSLKRVTAKVRKKRRGVNEGVV
ncbi:hypothetical protein JR316_0006088 [Psilocybe cubensis]|uniref:Uncharacterized protein n=2 Tax=Psilocybe cubensis TaxID=181762 RepID=A0ACB8H158_PSICU|nr:hypothetical protein JR316_0006088 [Psilocybe cubensis]KAH9481561.1 hypothetical protein JR316_0006088 [Psilocybe cubensis]